jgi:hypothetical protein
LRTAAELLGLKELLTKIEFDWVGANTASGAEGGGKDKLDAAFKLLRNNPRFVFARTLFLHDADSKRLEEQNGDLFVRRLPTNDGNRICVSGIENLPPEDVFEERFYELKERRTADITTTKILRKKALCQYVCSERRSAGDFENFRAPLEQIMKTLLEQD